MALPLFGLETEYGAAGTTERGTCASPVLVAVTLHEAVARRAPHLPASMNGRLRGTPRHDVFLANGARLLIDCGHVEYATAECTAPAQLVACSRAGDRLLERAAAELVAQRVFRSIRITRRNTDHTDPDVTWGSHESYLCTSSPGTLAQPLVPHLVTRIVFTGAGGIPSPGAPFTLSPRVGFIDRDVYGDRQGRSRPIFNLRDEPLAGPGLRRVHIVCGESLTSEWAEYLRFGTTALLLALIQHEPGCPRLRLADPVAAMRCIAADPTCTQPVPLADGRRLTAIDIQRIYLEAVEGRLGAAWLPTWAAAVCERWRWTLHRLAADPSSLATVLDWPMRLALFLDHARRRGIEWDGRTPLHERPADAATATDAAGAPTRPLTARETLGLELCEIDIRFSQLGPEGIFRALDAAGVLGHRVVDDAGVRKAMATPPPTRARRRGALVREHAGDTRRWSCWWSGVFDHDERRIATLPDPFGADEPAWKPAEGDPDADPPVTDLRDWLFR